MTNIKAHLREDANEKIRNDPEETLSEEDSFLLPVKSEEELQSIEIQLCNKLNMKKLIKSLVHQAEGKSMPRIVGSVMTRTISNYLPTNYSWKEQNQKNSFKEKQLAEAFVSAVVTKCPAEARQDIIKSVQLWLAQAPTIC